MIELSDTCAIATGCLPGDSAGYPITIGAAGSYRLTSNLEITDANTTAIRISASDVAIDLAGFRIHGPNVCAVRPTTCSMTGSGSGIAVSNTGTVERVSVEGGSIVGMPGLGIQLGPASSIRFVRVSHNGVGISLAQGAIEGSIVFLNGNTGVFAVSDVAVGKVSSQLNGGEGFALGPGSSVSDSISLGNGEDGIHLGANSRVDGCVSQSNSQDGIDVGDGSVVVGVQAGANTFAGIHVGGGCLIQASSATGNSAGGIVTGIGANVIASTSISNPGAGITTGARSLVRGCSSSGNTGAGMLLGDDSGYRESLIAGNVGGTVLINGAGSFDALGGNHCTDAAGTVVPCP